MARIRWHLLPGRLRRRDHQHRSHGKNQMSLTSWNVKGKGEFISTDHMERIRRHILPGRWRGKMNLSAQITWWESDIIYSLEVEGERWIHQCRSHGKIRRHLLPGRWRVKVEFISTDHMERIRCHLLSERWREKVNSSAQIAWQESDVTYFLEGDGERWIHQQRLHGKNQMSLTSWKIKEKDEFISTDHRESDVTHKLDGEADRRIHQHRSHWENQTSLTSWKVKQKGKFISTDHIGRIGHHLLSGRWRRKATLSAQIAWGELEITYYLEGEGERWMCQHTWGESDITYFLEGEGKGEFVSTNHMRRIRCHLLSERWSRKANSSVQITWGELDITYFLED